MNQGIGMSSIDFNQPSNLKYKNSKCMRILPMALLATMGVGVTHSGVKPTTIKEHYLNEYILNNMKDSTKISKVIKNDAFALPKDGTVVAYSYLHPDLLNNIKR